MFMTWLKKGAVNELMTPTLFRDSLLTVPEVILPGGKHRGLHGGVLFGAPFSR